MIPVYYCCFLSTGDRSSFLPCRVSTSIPIHTTAGEKRNYSKEIVVLLALGEQHMRFDVGTDFKHSVLPPYYVLPYRMNIKQGFRWACSHCFKIKKHSMICPQEGEETYWVSCRRYGTQHKRIFPVGSYSSLRMMLLPMVKLSHNAILTLG